MSQQSDNRAVTQPGMLQVGSPLPFNIHTNDGTLLLREGIILYSEQQIETLVERGCYTIPLADEPETQKIESLVYRIDEHFTRYLVDGTDISQDIIRLATELEFQTRHHPDALIGIVHLRTDIKYSVIRAIQNTVLSILLAIRLQWDARSLSDLSSVATR